MVCADTSFLVSLFLDEDFTDQAWDWLGSVKQVVCYSELNQLEFTNALELRAGRGEINSSHIRDIKLSFEQMRQADRFRFQQSQREVWNHAGQLSEKYSAEIGLRTLDVWQVAFALSQKCSSFASFDFRQRKLCEALDLELNPMD